MNFEPISIDGDAIIIIREVDFLEKLNDGNASELDAEALKIILFTLKVIAEHSFIDSDEGVDPRAMMAARAKLSACMDSAASQVNQILAIGQGKTTGSEIGFPEFDPASPLYEEN